VPRCASAQLIDPDDGVRCARGNGESGRELYGAAAGPPVGAEADTAALFERDRGDCSVGAGGEQ